MGQIRVVLLFNEENERQREVGEYLKTQKRCKTVLITELVYDWMQRKNGGGKTSTAIPAEGAFQKSEEEIIRRIKKELISDEEFLTKLIGKKDGKDIVKTESLLPEKIDKENDGLDIDEDMLLAGLSMFETQMG